MEAQLKLALSLQPLLLPVCQVVTLTTHKRSVLQYLVAIGNGYERYTPKKRKKRLHSHRALAANLQLTCSGGSALSIGSPGVYCYRKNGGGGGVVLQELHSIEPARPRNNARE